MGRVIWLAVAPIWLAPLLGGVADRPYTLLLAAAGALACLAATLRQPLRLSWFHLWLGTALLATLLQVVPLPPSLWAAVAAGSDADLRAIVAGLGGAGRWWPLSSDVGATLHEAARLAGYLGLLAALGAATQPARAGQDGAGAVRGAILGSAALCAGLGVLAGLGVALPAPIAVPGGGATRALFPAGLYNSNHMAALVGLGALLALDAELVRLGDEASAEDLQNLVYEIGKNPDFGFENLRDWFKALYETLLGSSAGPRMGSFIALYGIANTRKLIAEALA